ncbi:MAG TPA: YjbE family putative metal transport protein [Caulobacteraceae bacterium]|nr:YjbE family putative metal transport protein [Caulobacteraceae bacterium]
MALAQSLFGLPGAASLAALAQIALIDLTLASDNAVAVGMAAAGLPTRQRNLAMALGLLCAVVLLCVLAVFAISLLKAGGGGLVLGGGLLLLLVSWQMWRDLRANEPRRRHGGDPGRPKTLLRALTLIFVADMSTSLDNVLAVAGVARNQPDWVLFTGIAASVALTGLAAAGVSRLLHRWPWIGYIGLLIVIYVAIRMTYDGAEQLDWVRF